MSKVIPSYVNQQEKSLQLLGTVVSKQANFCQVKLDVNQHKLPLSGQKSPTNLLLCTCKARLKKMGQEVMVGDLVEIEEPDYLDGSGVVSQILPRQTQLSRPAMANAGQIMLLFALAEPPLDPCQLSRFLVKAESTQLAVGLCFNKTDLINSEEQEIWRARLVSWGYNPLFISVAHRQGIEKLTTYLQDQITILAGPSGVGKSSLVNQLIPEVDLRVAKVSGKLSRGRHTTRHVELFNLPMGGFIADSPGFNQPDLDCLPTELANYFPEARARLALGNCQFSNCLHRDEPNCLVRGDWERYEYYLKFLSEAIAYHRTKQQKRDTESNWKLKVGESGEKYYEPKLESKKYRRRSRRFRKQTVQDVVDEYDDLSEDFDD